MGHAPNSNLFRRTVAVPTPIYITERSSSNILIAGLGDIGREVWGRREMICTNKS